jgi:phospholipid/cholesterol/gamma-HCH transport system substrate-binding protein
MQQRLSLEMKVGGFIVGGVALLVVFLFAIGDLATYFQPGYGLRVAFDSANGIGRGSPVQYAGVEVGKVEDIRIVYSEGRSSPHVELVARLPRHVTVRADDVVSISTFGLLGEKYLEIMPGPGQGAALKAGEVLAGKPPVSTERIIERSNEVLTQLKQTLEGLNSLVGDPEARIFLKETLQEARDATRNWKIVGERLNLALSHAETGQGTFGKLLYDEELYGRMVAFVEDLRQHPWKLLVRPKSQKSEVRSQKSDER